MKHRAACRVENYESCLHDVLLDLMKMVDTTSEERSEVVLSQDEEWNPQWEDLIPPLSPPDEDTSVAVDNLIATLGG